MNHSQILLVVSSFVTVAFASLDFPHWKQYDPIPGKLNCHVDGGAYWWDNATQEAFGFCIARIFNSSGCYNGILEYLYFSDEVFFTGDDGGTRFSQNNLDEVQVLDLKLPVLSWIPVSLKPPEWMLLDAQWPFGKYPRRFICRLSPAWRGSYNLVSIGTLENGVCQTVWGNGESRTEEFEVLAVNDRVARFFEIPGLIWSNITSAL